MSEYKVDFERASRELTPEERIKIKYLEKGKLLSDIMQDGDVILDVEFYVMVMITNEQSETGRYPRLYIWDSAGELYTTGSESIISRFCDMFDELAECRDVPISVCFGLRDSKKRSGSKYGVCYPVLS